MNERVLAAEDGIYCWPGRKMKATLFSAKLGRLVLTDQRLVFVSSGGSDAATRALQAAAMGPIGGVIGASTAGLDGSALQNPGSLEVSLGSLTRCVAVKRALSISFRAADGSEAEFAFSLRSSPCPVVTPGWTASTRRAATTRRRLPARPGRLPASDAFRDRERAASSDDVLAVTAAEDPQLPSPLLGA